MSMQRTIRRYIERNSKKVNSLSYKGLAAIGLIMTAVACAFVIVEAIV